MQNIDGIQKFKFRLSAPPKIDTRATQDLKGRGRGWYGWLVGVVRVTRQSLLVQVFGSVIIVSFALGTYTTWQAKGIMAEDSKSLPLTEKSEENTPGGSVTLAGEDIVLVTAEDNQIPNSVFYNMTLEQLEYYLEDGYKTSETRIREYQEKVLVDRKSHLVNYLQKKKSPLVSIVDTLAGLKHWRLVLAISNSESSLGRRCADNNCSGIGVEPGHPLWREYPSKAEWAKDLDRLIEKRYRSWTLEQMNGVYNYPGSENWLFAARQVLNDLKEIE